MTRIVRLGILAATAAIAVLAPAFAAGVTVGHFYSEVAKAKHLESASAASAEASLRSAGFELPKLGLDKSLTEGDLTAISAALGVATTTNKPAELVSEAQFNSYLSSFGVQLGAPKAGAAAPYQTYSQGGDPGNSGNGKGKKKGHNKSSSEPQ